MDVWSKIHLDEQNREVELISRALSKYLYKNGPIDEISRKYKMDIKDREILDEYTSNRIAGLLLLYLTKDFKRINDIVNKYNSPDSYHKNIIPEIEGYIKKE